jgi:hypothetical protein
VVAIRPPKREAYRIVSPEALMAGARQEKIAVLTRALALTTEAMDLLDGQGSDPEAAAYLALAQQQLRKRLVHSE